MRRDLGFGTHPVVHTVDCKIQLNSEFCNYLKCFLFLGALHLFQLRLDKSGDDRFGHSVSRRRRSFLARATMSFFAPSLRRPTAT
ncbi:MAG: hypothetical protein Q7J31_04870, partial [Syntrophales bacterium]|nr:hypothetical protein [Syntrophales bacterium]